MFKDSKNHTLNNNIIKAKKGGEHAW